MAENPSNGHAPDGQQNNANGSAASTPVMPRIAAPEGTRSARAFDGSPLPEETAETTAFDTALAYSEAEQRGEQADASAINGNSEPDYRADLQDSFGPQTNGDSAQASAPPLGISIEKIDEAKPEADELGTDETSGFDAYAPAGYDVGADEELVDEAADDPDPYRNHQPDLEAAGIDALATIEGEQLFADDGAGGDDGGAPPRDTALAAGESGRPDTPRDQEQGLFEHLNELRARLLHAMLGVIAVMVFTWSYTYQLQDWFAKPIRAVLNENGIKKGDLVLLGAPEAFTLYFQFSLTSALIIAMPWVLFQVWRFVEPALTNSERRYTLVLVPFSSTLFFMGAGLGYACAPLFFKFFLEYQPPGVLAQWKYDDSIILMAKMLLIFGLAFQVPIIIIFGHKIGLISRNLLIEYWRHAVVVIFIVVAVLTPTWDPVTMTACALPPCLLYLLSIWLVKWL